jgi:hypothetical protein
MSDEDLSRRNARAGRLRVAFEAKIVVAIHEQLGVDRAVRRMAGHAAVAHRLVFKNMRLGLLAMALRAGLVQPRHRQTARRLHDVHAVRIVALDAIHLAFNDRVMLRQVKFRVRFQVAGKTSRRVFAGIDDELAASAADLNMKAARPVTGFAAALPGHFRALEMNPCVRTGREGADVIRVTIIAGLIAYK